MESSPSPEITKDAVIAVLKTVEDPELFLDIWFLGLIYNITIEEEKVKIDMTFTTPLCPYGPQLAAEVKQKVGEIPGVKEVDLNIVLTPPWEPNDEVKGMLGFM